MEYKDKYNVLLFGITGRTGTLIAKQLLANSNKLIAIARRPEKVSLSHADLQVVQGDILDPESYADLIKSCDAVISAVGDRSRKPTSLYSDGIGHVLDKMQNAGCNRLICISACPVHPILTGQLCGRHNSRTNPQMANIRLPSTAT